MRPDRAKRGSLTGLRRGMPSHMAYDALSLSGRLAVVIGGTSGIGRALALGLARAGADVVASSRREAEVTATAAAIEALGVRTLRQCSDVTDRISLEALLERTRELGPVDVLVNCAGRTKRTPTLDVSEEEWQSILDCNLTGTLRACQLFGRGMLERGYGRIVNIASIAGKEGNPNASAYSASKAADQVAGRGMG